MSRLPQLSVPTYDLVLPISKKKVKFRPFLVKEQKVLLMAMESEDKDTIEKAIRQILNNCTITEIEVDTIPIIDIEFYFLNLRARSIGEIVELKYKCENEVDTKICGHTMDTSVNLLEIKIEEYKENFDVIKLSDTVGIKMKYPVFSVVDNLKDIKSSSDVGFELIANCVEYIYEGDNFIYSNEFTKEELLDFLDKLNSQQFEKIEAYFENLPELKHTIEFKCAKCGFDHKISLQGIESFFE